MTRRGRWPMSGGVWATYSEDEDVADAVKAALLEAIRADLKAPDPQTLALPDWVYGLGF